MATTPNPNSNQTPINIAKPAPAAEVKPPKKKTGLIVAIVIILLLAGAAGAYWWMNKNKKTESTGTTVEEKKDIESLTYQTFGGTYDLFIPATTAETGSYAAAATFEFNQQMYETLVQYSGITKIDPLLATSWTNPDSSTWLFNLKENVKFHDGNTMTADDVKASLDNATKIDDTSFDLSTMKSVTVVSPNQVKIVTTAPDPLFLQRLTSVFIYDSKAPKTAKYADPGTGPYVVKDGTTPTAKTATLTAFDGYHGGHIYTRNLTFTTADGDTATPKVETDAIAALKTGKINLVGPISPESATKAKQDSLTINDMKDLGIRIIGFNVTDKSSPVTKLKVRQAIYAGIDMDALLAAMKLTDTAQAESQLFTADIPGYNPAVTRVPFDKTKAKQLLTEAGYPNGTSVTISVLNTPAGLAAELTRQLKEVGITAKVVDEKDSDLFSDALFSKKLMSWSLYLTPTVLDASDTFLFLQQTEQTSWDTNPELDKMLEKANNTVDSAARIKILQDISKLTMDDVVAVPLYSQKPIWVSDKPYVLTQDTMNGDIGVFFWKVYQK